MTKTKMKALTKDFENLLNEDYKETMKKMSEDIAKIFHEHDKKTMQPKIKTTNPYSKQSIDLTQEELNLYNTIKGLEEREQYEPMQQAIDKFSKLNPKAYMVLLD